MKIVFRNAYVLTLNENKEYFVGDVGVQDNLIVYAGKHATGSWDKEIDCTGKILMPGFVNTHCHLPMTLFRNLGENTTFTNWWYDVIRPLEEKLTSNDIAVGAKLGAMELIRNGITTVTDLYMHGNTTAKVLADCGLRAHIGVGAITGKEVLDKQSLIHECEKISNMGNNIKPILYAHSIYSCDEDQIATLANFARDTNITLTIHLSETLNEVGDCYNKFGITPAEYLEQLGVFDGTRTLLAHCVHCDKDDVKLLAKYNTYIASNPSSNLILGSGIAPIYSFVNHSVPVCLGTDGAASNNAMDMFKEMFLLDNLQAGVLNKAKALSTYDALLCATQNGAKALGYNNLGTIKRGNLADIILIDTHAPNMQPLNDNICAIVNSANASNITLTMVDGKILYQDGKYYCNIDDDIFDKANSVSAKLRGIAK